MFVKTLKTVCGINSRNEGTAQLSELFRECLSSRSCTVQQKSYDNTEDISAAAVTIFYNR